MCNARYFYWFANLDSYLSHTRIPPYFFYFLETLGLSRNFRIFYEFITPLYIIKNGLITLWIKINFYKTLRILNITCMKINFSTFHIFLWICYFCASHIKCTVQVSSSTKWEVYGHISCTTAIFKYSKIRICEDCNMQRSQCDNILLLRVHPPAGRFSKTHNCRRKVAVELWDGRSLVLESLPCVPYSGLTTKERHSLSVGKKSTG